MNLIYVGHVDRGVHGGGGGNNSWVLTIPWLFMNEVKEKVKRGFFFYFQVGKI